MVFKTLRVSLGTIIYILDFVLQEAPISIISTSYLEARTWDATSLGWPNNPLKSPKHEGIIQGETFIQPTHI